MIEFKVLRKVQEISRLKDPGLWESRLSWKGRIIAVATLRVERAQENWFIFKGSVLKS